MSITNNPNFAMLRGDKTQKFLRNPQARQPAGLFLRWACSCQTTLPAIHASPVAEIEIRGKAAGPPVLGNGGCSIRENPTAPHEL
jgi:hypothetical protein